MAKLIAAKLQLLDYRILNFSYETRKGTPPNSDILDIDMDFDIGEDEENSARSVMVLYFEVNRKPASYKKAGFRLKMELVGLFEIKDASEDEKINMRLVNGLSILYGVVRDITIQFTAQTPSERILLPTANLIAFLKKHAADQDKQEQTKGNRSKKQTIKLS